MEIRKVMTGGVMIAALGAAGLGLAGTASADYNGSGHYKAPKVTYSTQKTVTVTKTSSTTVSNTTGNFGNGNSQQSATGNAGAINNPQVGFGTNVGLQVPTNTNNGASTGGAVTGPVKKAGVDTSAASLADQRAKQRQSATANESYNSTSVNTAAENGNFSKVEISSSN